MESVLRMNKLVDTKSIGLIGMSERLHKWNGIFNIIRNEKNGTTVYISVPLLNGEATMPGKQN